ncbi:MAG: hypothetical protein ACE5K1_07120 [Acidiferrobacterales bacterium]
MKQPSHKELQKLAQEAFGRDLSDVDVDTYKERLPGMVRTIDIIREWEDRLGETEPAAVHRVPLARQESDVPD